MKILITGGAGFIGSHLVRFWLERHPEDEVVTLDALTYAGSPERLADVKNRPGYRFIKGDVCDAEAVDAALAGCRTVIHCAAETHVDRSIINAAPFLRTNVEGTYTVLRAALAHRVERFLHVSTDEVYGPVPEGAVDEGAPLSPRSPYAASKAAGDLLAQAFRQTYGLPLIVIRPTNVFGPWQLPEKFIPLCAANAQDGVPIPVYGDGQQRRSWLFVTDLSEAFETVLARGLVGDVYNVGGMAEQPNLETARRIVSLMGGSPELIRFVEDRPGHDRRYALNDAKLRLLGWRPTTPFEEGLAETVAWYRQHHDWWRPLAQKLREDSDHWLNRPARPSTRQPSGALR